MLPGITGSLVSGSFLRDVFGVELRGRPHPPLSSLQRWWRRESHRLGPASSARAVVDLGALPLLELCGHHAITLEPCGSGFVGRFGTGSEPSIVVRTTAWAADPESAWRDTVRAGRAVGARWGFVFSGSALRIVDARRTWSRRALDIHFAEALLDERSATVLWALLQSATRDEAPTATTLAAVVERSDAQAIDVCASLGNGVLEALGALLAALEKRRGAAARTTEREIFEQAVTVVYRMLFLLFAEARALVPVWHRVYRDAYTIDALCRRSAERREPTGLWETLQAIARMAHAGCHAGDLVVTAFNGRLFAPRHTPLAERAGVPDSVVRRAVLALATSPSATGIRRIAYADLDVEQLGAVYERVLEYEPRRDAGPLVLTRTSHDRKTTGSFYTPRAMTDFLVRRTLHPLVAGKSSDEILALRVLDPAMGSGAFLVAACRYLAAAIERTLKERGEWSAGEGAPSARAALRRTVAQRCLYGVDRNPMAVQLARLSLWLTTLTRDRPLSFLDHRLAVGDSLIGARLADLARGVPRQGRVRKDDPHLPSLFVDSTAEEMAAHVLPDRWRLAAEPDVSAAVIQEKERLLASLTAEGTPLARWKAAADLWCAAWLWPGQRLSSGAFADTLASLLGRAPMLQDRQRREMMDSASALAGAHRFFHWELEFPEIFFGTDGSRRRDGGFDAVLGNPPWDVLRADTGNRSERDRARTHQVAQLRFLRDARVYEAQGSGHSNSYQFFVERALQLTRPGGRLGLILPSGFATDAGSGPLRKAVLDGVRVDRLIGFDNRHALFPIHRDVRFLLVTGSSGARTEALTCAFGRTRADWLDQLPDAVTEDPPEVRAVVLSRHLLEAWDGSRLAIPLLTTRADLDILVHARAVARPLGDPAGWHASFGRELNATDDKPHFTSRQGKRSRHGAGGLLTVLEGKHLEPFRILADASRVAIPSKVAATLVDATRSFTRQRLAYRDVASATNRLTLIAALLPPGTISTHTIFCLKTPVRDAADQYYLLALLNSLVANYLVRLQVTTHVSATLMARLPVPRPPRDSRAYAELVALAQSLEQTGMTDTATYARLNALAAAEYELTMAQYEHIVGSFPLLEKELRDVCIAAYRRASETQRLRG
jgi:hypothetical protein